MAKKKGRRGYRTTQLQLKNSTLTIYTSPRLADALEDLAEDMTLYQGVRFGQILEAVYSQGKKDGAREVFEEFDARLTEAKRAIPHRRPGRPKRT
jgi:hypothetical protein